MVVGPNAGASNRSGRFVCWRRLRIRGCAIGHAHGISSGYSHRDRIGARSCPWRFHIHSHTRFHTHSDPPHPSCQTLGAVNQPSQAVGTCHLAQSAGAACLRVGGAYLPTSAVPTIRFEKEGQQVGCIEGANLRKAALDAGINPYAGLNNLNNCSGLGQCGTCVVEVVEGARNLSPRSDVEEVYLADRPANYRLSCRTSVNGDVTIRTKPDGGVGKGSNSLVGALKALVKRR